MAKLVIVNKNKPDIVVKSFICNITKICTRVYTYPDTLYHNGNNALPTDGDIIYQLNTTTMQYEIFKENSGLIKTYTSATSLPISFKTDYEGKCIIINCN